MGAVNSPRSADVIHVVNLKRKKMTARKNNNYSDTKP